VKVMILGRSRPLLDSAKAIFNAGHEVALIHTTSAEEYYACDETEFEEFAATNLIPFVNSKNLSSSKQLVADLKPDICISMNWISLIGQDFINMFAQGIVNAHLGDLPRYRGNAAPNWAILNQEPRIAVSIHLMDDGLDSGPVLLQEFFDLEEDTYVGEIYEWLNSRIPVLFETVVTKRRNLTPSPQDSSTRPLRAFPRRLTDSQISWAIPTKAVLRLIRASSTPFEGAFTYLEGKQLLRIFRAREFFPEFDFLAIPGQVCFAHAGAPVIATSDGMILIEECRLEDFDNLTSQQTILKSLRNRLS